MAADTALTLKEPNIMRRTVTLKDLQEFRSIGEELARLTVDLAKDGLIAAEKVEEIAAQGDHDGAVHFGLDATDDLMNKFLELMEKYERQVLNFLGERKGLLESPADFLARIGDLGEEGMLATMAFNDIALELT